MPIFDDIKRIITDLEKLKSVTVAGNLLANYAKNEQEQIKKLQELYNKEIGFLHTPDGSGVSTTNKKTNASFIDKIAGLNDCLPQLSTTSDVTNIASFSTVDGFLDTEITQRLAKMQSEKPKMKAALAEAEKNMKEMKTKVDDGLANADKDLKAAHKQLRFKDRFTSDGRRTRKELNENIRQLKESKKDFRRNYATAVKNFKFAKTELMTFKENKRTAKATAYKKYDIITEKTFLNTLANKRLTGVWDVVHNAYLFLTDLVDGAPFTVGCKTDLKNLIDAFSATGDKSYNDNKEKISIAYEHVSLTLRAMGDAKLPDGTVDKLKGIIGGFDKLVDQSTRRSKKFMDSYVAEFKTKVKFFSNSAGNMPDVAPQRSFKLLTDDLNSWYNQGVKTCKEFTLDGVGTGTIDKIREKLEYLWYIINLTAAYSYSTYLFDYKDSNVVQYAAICIFIILICGSFVSVGSSEFVVVLLSVFGVLSEFPAIFGMRFLENKSQVYERGYDERWAPSEPNAAEREEK